MPLAIALIALAIVLGYFILTSRQRDETWEAYRERQRKRNQRPSTNQPPDPNFQFDPSDKP